MTKYQEAFENIFPTKDFKSYFPQFTGVIKMMEIKRKDYEVIKELVEKTTSKKQIKKYVGYLKDDSGNKRDIYLPYCPNCGFPLEESYVSYCDECGQRIDWSEEDD